jgi:hypothetical protein
MSSRVIVSMMCIAVVAFACGPRTHPGGGIMGASGRLAALRILGDGR